MRSTVDYLARFIIKTGTLCCVFVFLNVWISQGSEFLKNHWRTPLISQGDLASIGMSLDPELCGSCHESQYSNWKHSLHAKSMGPGMIGQLIEMGPYEMGKHQACIRCHAPLWEQQDALTQALDKKTLLFDKGLQTKGLVCAGCHLREGRWYGPIATNKQTDKSDLPHNGFIETKEFSDSKFCAGCHQFKPGEYSLNGKLIENTYEE